MPWPPKSPTIQSFPEIDRAEWFNLVIAREKILKTQLPFLDRLEKITGAEFDDRKVNPA
jgi:predicted NUDIX family NTP pyrophosphohydrolase